MRALAPLPAPIEPGGAWYTLTSISDCQFVWDKRKNNRSEEIFVYTYSEIIPTPLRMWDITQGRRAVKSSIGEKDLNERWREVVRRKRCLEM